MTGWLPDRLPEDLESERCLLATLCAPGAEAVAAEIAFRMREEAFVHPAHRLVFRALRTLLTQRLEVHAISLKACLEETGELGRVGGFAGLVDIVSAEEVGRPSQLEHILVRKLQQRELIRIGAGLVRDASEETEVPAVLADRVSHDLGKLVQDRADAGPESLEDLSNDAVLRLMDRIDGVRDEGIKVGYSKLDGLTHGFQPGQLIILAARPGVGKTALALNWALNVVKRGQRAAFFTLEMTKGEVFDRLVSSYGRLDLKSLYHLRGQEVEIAKAKVLEAADRIRGFPLHVDDRSQTTVGQIVAKCDRLEVQAREKLGLVVVDYLQLLSSPADSRASRQSEAVRVGEISRGLKLFAKDRRVPVVVLSQLNREVEARSGHRPQLSDLRDSGSLEQDADIVAFIHRRILPGDDPRSAETELILAKHRNGPMGCIPMGYEGQYFHYREVERTTATDSGPVRRDKAWVD